MTRCMNDVTKVCDILRTGIHEEVSAGAVGEIVAKLAGGNSYVTLCQEPDKRHAA